MKAEAKAECNFEPSFIKSNNIGNTCFKSSWARFGRGSQTSPIFWNKMNHDKFSTASGLCGRYLPLRKVRSPDVVASSASLIIN